MCGGGEVDEECGDDDTLADVLEHERWRCLQREDILRPRHVMCSVCDIMSAVWQGRDALPVKRLTLSVTWEEN